MNWPNVYTVDCPRCRDGYVRACGQSCLCTLCNGSAVASFDVETAERDGELACALRDQDQVTFRQFQAEWDESRADEIEAAEAAESEAA